MGAFEVGIEATGIATSRLLPGRYPVHVGGFVGLVCLGTLLIQGDLEVQVATDVNIARGHDISALGE
jgi:hypothetical protein